MHPYKKVAFYTLGCKLNFSETSTIARQFEQQGFARVAFTDSPDVVVVNTCSVTESADKKCRQIVKRALQNNPDVSVIVIGCYAQLKPDEIAKIPGVDLVLGANEKFNITAHLSTLHKAEHPVVRANDIRETRDFVPAYSMGDRTRSFLKVQDGCDYFCTFCTIPLARGKSRNATLSATLDTARKLAQTPVREVVLTGVNIGDFGQGTDENFEQLVRELDQISGVDRWRISSIEPNLLSDELITFVAQSRHFVPHFHIPLQSGSDAILKAMRRKYLTELYADRVRHIKAQMPHACVGADVIVGFPGETEEEFLKTVRFLNELDVDYLHVFTYSERAHTTAKKMRSAVPIAVRRERSRQLQSLSHKKRRRFYTSQLHRQMPVLFESEEKEGMMYGFTDNYVKVKFPYQSDWVNTIVPVTLTAIDSSGYALAQPA